MEKLILTVHVLTALTIIGLILLQQGKGADMGASFGAGASQTVFGSRGSGNFFTRATAILAFLFFSTSFGLALVAKNQAEVGFDSDIPTVREEAGEVPSISEEESEIPSVTEDSSSDDVERGDDSKKSQKEDAPESNQSESDEPVSRDSKEKE